MKSIKLIFIKIVPSLHNYFVHTQVLNELLFDCFEFISSASLHGNIYTTIIIAYQMTTLTIFVKVLEIKEKNCTMLTNC